jgi:hypothetical protein
MPGVSTAPGIRWLVSSAAISPWVLWSGLVSSFFQRSGKLPDHVVAGQKDHAPGLENWNVVVLGREHAVRVVQGGEWFAGCGR